MNPSILIDSIVRQTTVLIAQLATAAGMRTPLAHVANQVFLNLAEELRGHGVGQKVIADMFGLALRTYHDRMRRLSESATDQGRTLWEAVLSYVQEQGEVKRAEVLRRFRHDDDATVRGVLSDIVANGLVEASGRGASTLYKAVPAEDLKVIDDPEMRRNAHIALVWVATYRVAPASRSQIADAVAGLDADTVDDALEQLVADGRVRSETVDGAVQYHCEECTIPRTSRVGWEAAVFDHYQAMITAVGRKLRLQPAEFTRPDIGGCTYSFAIHPGHPLEDEVLGLLEEVRGRASALRARVDEASRANGESNDGYKVVFYAGQTLVGDES